MLGAARRVVVGQGVRPGAHRLAAVRRRGNRDLHRSPLELGGKNYRPDGLIRVTRGQKVWTALVEIKTGRNDLDAEQVATYLDIAREQGYDAVITISHQVATTPGVHPVTVDKRKTRKVDLHPPFVEPYPHRGEIQHSNHEVADPDQAWLLSEFIRYIEDPKSGALDFEDMGPSWVAVRNGAANRHCGRTMRRPSLSWLDSISSSPSVAWSSPGDWASTSPSGCPSPSSRSGALASGSGGRPRQGWPALGCTDRAQRGGAR